MKGIICGPPVLSEKPLPKLPFLRVVTQEDRRNLLKDPGAHRLDPNGCISFSIKVLQDTGDGSIEYHNHDITLDGNAVMQIYCPSESGIGDRPSKRAMGCIFYVHESRDEAELEAYLVDYTDMNDQFLAFRASCRRTVRIGNNSFVTSTCRIGTLGKELIPHSSPDSERTREVCEVSWIQLKRLVWQRNTWSLEDDLNRSFAAVCA